MGDVVRLWPERAAKAPPRRRRSDRPAEDVREVPATLLTRIGLCHWREAEAGPEGRLALAPFMPRDLIRCEDWLTRPHVRRWWGEPEAGWSEIAEAMEEAHVAPFVLRLDDTPIGYLQMVHSNAEPNVWPLPLVAETVGLDLFVADASLVGRGIGRRALRLAAETAFGDPRIRRVTGDPDPRNAASLACFRAAGFGHVLTAVTGAGPMACMVLDRPA